MEMTKAVEIDDKMLYAYDIVSISELEAGTKFGIITSDVGVIEPRCTTIKGDLSYSFYILEQEKMNTKHMPLIFEKIEGNLAKELLTGNVFVLGNGLTPLDIDDISTTIDDIEIFANGVKKYQDNSGYFNIGRTTGYVDGNHKGSCCPFVVDDAFKELFAKETLKNREEATRYLNSFSEYANAIFDSSFDDVKNTARNIAEVDDFLFESDRIK